MTVFIIEHNAVIAVLGNNLEVVLIYVLEIFIELF